MLRIVRNDFDQVIEFRQCSGRFGPAEYGFDHLELPLSAAEIRIHPAAPDDCQRLLAVQFLLAFLKFSVAVIIGVRLLHVERHVELDTADRIHHIDDRRHVHTHVEVHRDIEQ